MVILRYAHFLILKIQAGFRLKVTQVMFPILCLGGCLQVHPNCNTTHSVARLTAFAPQSFSTRITYGCTDALRIQSGAGKLFVPLASRSHERYVSTWCLKSEQQHYICPDTKGSYACLILQTSSFQAHLPYVEKPEKKNKGHKHYKVA